MPPELENELEQEVVENEVVENTPEETPIESEEPAQEEESEEAPEEPTPGEEGGEEEEGEEQPEVPAFKANTKFKAGVYNKETRELEQKEYDIDKRFHSLMKTPEDEKLVRELHEKAYGLDSVKERYNETRTFANNVFQENTDIKKSIDEVRTIYRSAVASGNYHKLDKFFDKLQVPQDVVLSYALAKVQLNEMDPAQRNAIVGQLDAENKAEELARQQAQTSESFAQIAHQNKQIQLDFTLNRAEVSPLAQAFDERMGTPGAFKKAVEQAGQLAWLTSKQDLTPEQAVQAVIKQYNLTTSPMVPPAKVNAGQGQPGAGGAQKPVVKRAAGTIPNVQGRSTSPLKSKPKDMDALLKYRKEQHGF